MIFICSQCGTKKFYDVTDMSKMLIAKNLRQGLIHGPNGEHAIDMVLEQA